MIWATRAIASLLTEIKARSPEGERAFFIGLTFFNTWVYEQFTSKIKV